jgi:hypothetical protein
MANNYYLSAKMKQMPVISIQIMPSFLNIPLRQIEFEEFFLSGYYEV